MKKVKITVLKRTFDEELAAEFAAPDLGPCHLQDVGQVFYADWQKPEGLCDEAWASMRHFVIAMAHGSQDFFDGHWVNDNIAICSCNDGLRPVIYKLELEE